MSKTRDAYVAIADSTRREILNMLAERQMISAGEIASQFRGVSRPAISRHLRILKECGVVVSLRHGKTQKYSLNPEPIQKIREGWLRSFSKLQTQSPAKLRAIVE